MVAPIEVTVDAKGMPLPAVDPNVTIPANVQRASAAANAIHAQAYQTQPVQPGTQLASAPVQSGTQLAPAPVTVAATPQPEPVPENRQNWTPEQWRAHAMTMEGRFKKSSEQNRSLQATVAGLGEDLVRMQTAAPLPQVTVPAPTLPAAPPQNFLTPQDHEQYGEDFLSVAQRAALQAVAPKLTELAQRNAQLEQRLKRQNVTTMESVLDTQVPNWGEINVNPRFKAWLALRDVYSGQVRQKMMLAAYSAGDASRVAAFFKGFLDEEDATGNSDPLLGMEPAPLTASPLQPAVALQALAAPGHARPATATAPTPASEPQWITRGQVATFFDNVRKGVYRGREQDYLNDQALIFEAQRAGRII